MRVTLTECGLQKPDWHSALCVPDGSGLHFILAHEMLTKCTRSIKTLVSGLEGRHYQAVFAALAGMMSACNSKMEGFSS